MKNLSELHLRSLNNTPHTYLGRTIVCDLKSANGRIYSFDEVTKAMEVFKAKLEQDTVFGELDHSEHLISSLSRASHVIQDLWITEYCGHNVLEVKIQTLATPNGQIAQSIFKSGIRLFLSAKGTGNVIAPKRGDQPGPNDGQVTDFEIYTFDIIASSSFDILI